MYIIPAYFTQIFAPIAPGLFERPAQIRPAFSAVMPPSTSSIISPQSGIISSNFVVRDLWINVQRVALCESVGVWSKHVEGGASKRGQLNITDAEV